MLTTFATFIVAMCALPTLIMQDVSVSMVQLLGAFEMETPAHCISFVIIINQLITNNEIKMYIRSSNRQGSVQIKHK